MDEKKTHWADEWINPQNFTENYLCCQGCKYVKEEYHHGVCQKYPYPKDKPLKLLSTDDHNACEFYEKAYPQANYPKF